MVVLKGETNFVRELRRREHRGLALICGEREISYLEFFSLVTEAREWIENLSSGEFQPGTRVGVRLEDGLGHLVVALAVLEAGGCFVPIAMELSEDEVATLTEEAALSLVISGQGQFEQLTLSELRVQQRQANPSFNEDEFCSLNPAFIRFSSGTTGSSKGVVLSHETMRERVRAANRGLEVEEGERVLWMLSMAHHFVVTWMLYFDVGATVVLVEERSPKALVAAARRYEVTFLYGSPFHFLELSQVNDGEGLKNLRLAVSTAAMLSPEISQAFEKRFGKALSPALGVIEVGLPLLNPDGRAEGLGGELPDYDVCQEGGEDVGELRIRGPGLLDAYLSPWQLRDEILKEGWFCTGDLVRQGGEGAWILVGRRKSVLNVGGMKVFPEEVEAVLNSHPAVKESRVFAERHALVGDYPAAELALKAAAEVSERDLKAFCEGRLASYKLPLRWDFVDAIERTASGKIRRF